MASDCRTRSYSTCRPCVDFKSSAILDFPRFTERKKPESPSNTVEWLDTLRDKSPSSGSTLITSAPSWASNWLANGPPSTQVRSSTRKPLSISAPEMLVFYGTECRKCSYDARNSGHRKSTKNRMMCSNLTIDGDEPTVPGLS